MEEKQRTPSVIARLMGLDKKPIQQTPHRPQKVLSDEYLRKTSCIAVLGKRSHFVDILNRPNAKKNEKHLNSNETSCTDKGYISSNCDEKESPKERRIEFSFSRKRCMYAKSASEFEMLSHSSRFVGLGKDKHARDQLRDPHPYISGDKLAKSNALESHVEPYGLSASRGDVCKKLKKNTSDRTTMRSLKFENHGSLRSRSVFRTKMDQSSLALSKRLMKSSEKTYDCMKVHQISHSFPSSLFFGMEAEKKTFGSWKTKIVEEGEGYDTGARIKRLYPEIGKLKQPQGINSKLVGPSGINRKNGLKNPYSQKTARPNLSVIASRSHNFQTGSDANNETPTKLQDAVSMSEDCFERGLFSTSFEKQLDRSGHLQCSDNCGSDISGDLHCCSAENEQRSTVSDLTSTNWTADKETATSYEDGASEISRGSFSEKDGSSDVHGDLDSKISSCEANKGWISGCQYDHDSSVILGDANQPTPDSVLEPPFKEDASPIADLKGLAMKLQLLDSISEETNSVCSVMAVSSDEEDTEMASCELPQNSGNIWEMIRPEESRDFSYLVDVLDEADISDGNLHQLWHANEPAMDISVFELLEKKYGKQTSWQKSERRLLFDRVNSLLSMILHSFSNCNTVAVPLKRRFWPGMRRDDIEDELWSLLVVQGKEVSKDLDEKALAKDMKWLELEEDVTSISIEIEQLLFHELVAELVREC